jgi:hypothetical protein
MDFKLLEQIVDEQPQTGDLILLREYLFDGFKPYGDHTEPVYFGSLDTLSIRKGKSSGPARAYRVCASTIASMRRWVPTR